MQNRKILWSLLTGKTPSPIWDRLVFNKIRAKLGGRVRLMTSGASPISPDVLDFLRMYGVASVFFAVLEFKFD